MAKKHEFRPDKPRAGWASKLYLTRLQRLAALKWLLYSLMLLALSVLQDVILSQYRFFGSPTELVPCGIFLICILEGMERGSIFTLIAALAYLFSGSAPGAYSLVLITFLAIGVAFLRQSYLQKGFSAAMLCTAAAMVVYELLTFAIGAFLGMTGWDRWGIFCLTAVLSLIAAPILYPILLSIGTIGGESWKD